MKSVELIRWSLALSDQLVARLVADMARTPMVRSCGSTGNHPLWIIGHFAAIEGAMAESVFGEPNPVAHWTPLFAAGTQPSSDPAAYPPFEEVLGAFRRLRGRTLSLLEKLDDADLDKAPRDVPPGFEDEMKTIGRNLLLTSLHNMMHFGQIADCRRVAGHAPMV